MEEVVAPVERIEERERETAALEEERRGRLG